jgi:hypothetical protein
MCKRKSLSTCDLPVEECLFLSNAVSSAEGDWRDWEAIGEWAHDLQPVL